MLIISENLKKVFLYIAGTLWHTIINLRANDFPSKFQAVATAKVVSF